MSLRAPHSGGRRRYDQGVLATLCGVVISGVLTAIAHRPSVLEPVAVALMQRTPLAAANWLVEHFGFWARPLAMSGAVAVAMLAGGILGLCMPGPRASYRRRWLSLIVVAALSLAFVVWLSKRGAWSPAIAVLVLGWCAGRFLLERIRWPAESSKPQVGVPRVSRRLALQHMLNGGVVLALVATFLTLSNAATLRLALSGGYPRRRFFGFIPPPARNFKFASMSPSMVPEVTPVSAFYVMSKNVTDPAIAPEAWSLRIDGAVGARQDLRYADLLAFPRRDQYVTLRCVSNPLGGQLMSNALFSGALLSDVLVGAKPQPNAAWMRFSSPDHHRSVVPLVDLVAAGALIVYGLDGESISRELGGPARLLVPGRYGFHNVKWLTRIELLTHPADGYWEARGWTATDVHTLARIDDVQRQTDTTVLVAGIAFAGRRGISSVEVRLDDGPWIAAELHVPALAKTAWVQWRIQLPEPRGKVHVSARAVDGDGQAQIEVEQPIYPNGASGLHVVSWDG